MRILVMTILDLSRDMNGVVVSANEHIQLLKRKAWDVVVLTPYTDPAKSLKKVLYWGSSLFRRTQWSWLTLFNLMIKAIILSSNLHKCDLQKRILHAHDVMSAGILLLVTRGKQSVFLQSHFHSHPWDEFQQAGLIKKNSLSYRILRSGLLRILHHHRLAFLPTSHDNKRFLQQLLHNEPWIAGVLYPGIQTSQPMENSDHAYLINVGSIDARKNQIMLVDILKELEEMAAGMRLVLVGPIDQTEMLRIQRRKQQLQVRNEIVFTGPMTSEKTRELIAGAKLYIHTAFKESFGRTLVEAMASKTPVVAMDYPAAHEILNPSAILPRHWKVSEIAQFIATLLATPQHLEKMQEEQYRRFIKCFTESVMFKNYLATIQPQGAYHAS